MRYGYLGPIGTFSEEVASKYYRKDSIGVPFRTNREVVEAVADGEVNEGIVPLENTLEGTVNQVIDAIIERETLKVKQEIIFPIKQSLIGLVSYRIDMIEKVLSHPHALAQCQKWLAKNLPYAAIIETSSTAKAVEIIAKERKSFNVAIGNSRIAGEYDLICVIADSIQDNPDNKTRFVVVSNNGNTDDEPIIKSAKTSIAFSVKRGNEAGSLVDILMPLKKFGINMTKVESRPQKNKIGNYIFMVDFEGDYRALAIFEALKEVRKLSTMFRILGSYPTKEY